MVCANTRKGALFIPKILDEKQMAKKSSWISFPKIWNTCCCFSHFPPSIREETSKKFIPLLRSPVYCLLSKRKQKPEKECKWSAPSLLECSLELRSKENQRTRLVYTTQWEINHSLTLILSLMRGTNRSRLSSQSHNSFPHLEQQ